MHLQVVRGWHSCSVVNIVTQQQNVLSSGQLVGVFLCGDPQIKSMQETLVLSCVCLHVHILFQASDYSTLSRTSRY